MKEGGLLFVTLRSLKPWHTPPLLSLSLSLSLNGKPLMKSGALRWSSTYDVRVIEQFCQKTFQQNQN
jgi:hypothetical protein